MFVVNGYTIRFRDCGKHSYYIARKVINGYPRVFSSKDLSYLKKKCMAR